jgi:LL-diaminopimelate aminotransferase
MMTVMGIAYGPETDEQWEASMQLARRMRRIPPYLFADIDRKKAALRARGVDVIDIAVGDPDLPTPEHIIAALSEAARDPATHVYPPYEGTREFREAVAGWYQRRFGVSLDPERQVLTLIGSKEGLAHIPWVWVDPGDVVLVSDPGYPVYATATLLAEGEPYPVPLRPEHGWLPDLGAIPDEVARKARVFFLNYPNNPTAATADLGFFEEVVNFARRWGIFVVHDNTYSEIAYDGYRPPSFLQARGALEVGIELHSLSKTYCMTGWRLGWAVGNADAVQALGTLKTNIDSGQFMAIQAAGAAALTGPQDPVRERVGVWQRRRDVVVAALRKLGLEVPTPRATFYLWIPVPDGYDSVGFARHLLDRAGVVVAPGISYGSRGEGYIRISLTASDVRFAEAIRRIGDHVGAPTPRAAR